MPSSSVTAKLRGTPVRSSRRIAHTPIWQVNDEMHQDDRRRQDQVQVGAPVSVVMISGSGLSRCSNSVGGQTCTTPTPPTTSV